MYCSPLCLTGGGQYSRKIRFIEPQGINWHWRPVPGATSSGTPRGVLWVPGPLGQYSGKIHFIDKPWVQTRWVAIWLNVVLTPGSLPRSQSSGTGPSASCGYCCPLCPTGVSIQEKFVLSSPRGYIHRRPVPGAPSSGTPSESQAKFRDGTVWGL